jgi:hypothetical protein
MTTRYTAESKSRFGTPGLPSGYQGKSSPDIVIPSVGIEDVDKALFALLNEEIPLIVTGQDTDAKRVPVIFAAGEKWALNKRMRVLKDRNGSLILPLCTAVRTSIVQDPTLDITGRGINQQTGEIVIHRRLDKSDRAYQTLINRLLLKHQSNLAVKPGQGDAGQLTTLRDIGDLSDDPIVQQGGLLLPDRRNNVFETIVVPAPQFFTAKYDVTLWTQYTSHMNQLLEAMIASQLPQGQCWRLDTPKGYWFLANIDSSGMESDSNADDYAQSERLIRYKFVINVPGYILASSAPGAPVPIKRYVSTPSISFSVGVDDGVFAEPVGEDTPFLGADDPTLPLEHESQGARPPRRDARNRTDTRLLPPNSLTNPDDPALKSLPRGTKPQQVVKVRGVDKNGRLTTRVYKVGGTTNSQGETVLASDANLGGLSIIVADN